MRNRIKILFLRSVCQFSLQPLKTSRFHYSYRNSFCRLWDWKASERDSVIVIGKLIQYHIQIIQQLFNLFRDKPYLASLETSFPIVMQRVERAYDSHQCDYESDSFISSIFTITKEMMYFIMKPAIEDHPIPHSLYHRVLTYLMFSSHHHLIIFISKPTHQLYFNLSLSRQHKHLFYRHL